MDDATMTPLAGAGRTLAGATGALLTPRLGTATGDVAASLGGLGALTPAGHLALDDVMHDVDVGLDAVHLSGELGGRYRRALRILDFKLRHSVFSLV